MFYVNVILVPISFACIIYIIRRQILHKMAFLFEIFKIISLVVSYTMKVAKTYIFKSSSTLGTFNLQDALETPSYSSLIPLMIFFISSLTLSG